LSLIFFAILLASLLTYELIKGKFFGQSGRIIRRDEHPWIYWSFAAVEIALLAFLLLIVVRDLYLKSHN
jgi:hypothetical protein